MPERLNLPVDCDMTQTSLEWALKLLGEAPVAVVVHPYAKHLASFLLWRLGWKRVEVFIDTDITDEDTWYLRGDTREVFSNGA